MHIPHNNESQTKMHKQFTILPTSFSVTYPQSQQTAFEVSHALCWLISTHTSIYTHRYLLAPAKGKLYYPIVLPFAVFQLFFMTTSQGSRCSTKKRYDAHRYLMQSFSLVYAFRFSLFLYHPIKF